jgi:hypothetical protein
MRFWKAKPKGTSSTTMDRKIPMTKIYTDKNGVSWYEYNNPLTIPAKRAISAEVATRFADMNLTRHQMIRLIQEMKRNANEGKIVDLFHLLAEVEFRINYLGEEETLLELATIYFVIDGEDETGMDEMSKKKKRDLLKSDEEALSFFLERAWKLTTKFSESSEFAIVEYLKINQVNIEKLNHSIHKLKSTDILMT